jgi:hypothetical protein
MYCPVCLVLKPGAVASLARIFPFDSGAATGGRFDPPVPGIDRDRYSLGPALLTAQRVVEAFFETNQKYYVGEPRTVFTPPGGEQEIQNYWQLINTTGMASFDDRRSAIEVQSRASLALKDNLHAVILPIAFLEEPEVRRVIMHDWRAIPVTYDTYRGAIPNEYVRVIVEKLRVLFAAYF